MAAVAVRLKVARGARCGRIPREVPMELPEVLSVGNARAVTLAAVLRGMAGRTCRDAAEAMVLLPPRPVCHGKGSCTHPLAREAPLVAGVARERLILLRMATKAVKHVNSLYELLVRTVHDGIVAPNTALVAGAGGVIDPDCPVADALADVMASLTALVGDLKGILSGEIPDLQAHPHEHGGSKAQLPNRVR